MADDISFIRQLKVARDNCIKHCKKNSICDELMSKYNLERAPYDQVIKRPEVLISDIVNSLQSIFDEETIKRAIIEIRYEGYIKRQQKQIDKLQKLDYISIPDSIDYGAMLGLRAESRDKLIKFKPKTILEAKKIAGINPADLMIVLANVR